MSSDPPIPPKMPDPPEPGDRDEHHEEPSAAGASSDSSNEPERGYALHEHDEPVPDSGDGGVRGANRA